MSSNPKRIGSWNGLMLMQQTGESSCGIHRHASHMLRLQTHGVSLSEWQDNGKSGATILEPGSLAVFSAGHHHGKCSDKRYPSSDEHRQIVAVLTDIIGQ